MSIEVEIINSIAPKLEKFVWVSPEKAIFRCPRCGDSKRDPNKTRGALFCQGGTWFNGCFNGCETIPFGKFLRDFDVSAFKEYRLGRLRTGDFASSSFNLGGTSKEKSNVNSAKTKSVGNVMDLFDGLFDRIPKLSELPKDHPARVYYASRKLPKSRLDWFYYADNFNEWSMSVNGRQELSGSTQGGIVIPLIDINGEEFGYQCRFIEDGPLRYKTIMVDETQIKCFGMDRVDRTKKINVFEGVFDSLYLPNSIATLDANLHETCDKLSIKHDIPKSDWVLWYDFEKFNDQIIEKKKTAIEHGYSVVFVDRDLVTNKDINAIVQNSSNPIQALKSLFKSAKILSGTRAKVEMTLNSRMM